MRFNEHSNLKDKHAFLSASKYHWVNYSEERLAETYNKYRAAERGTRYHEFAKEAILLGVKLPRTKSTLNLYVNDAIGFKMVPEQVLYYSDNCFGTADAIVFKSNTLRIHDLKTGVSPASVKQLEVYAALFCLEYEYSPMDINMELRIYQNNEVLIHNPEPDDIGNIMYTIILFDKQIEQMKVE